MATKTKKSVKNRSQKRARRTRKKLKKAALDVFSEKSVDAATVEEITEKADVGKGTLYQHFEDKEEIVVTLVDEAVEHLIERIRAYDSAPELDPLAPIYYAWQGWQYWWTGQYDEAIDEARKSLELDSDFPIGLYVLGSVYAEKGMYEEAIKAHQRAGVVGRAWKYALGRTYAMAGRQDEARQVLTELEVDSTPWDTWFIAQIYAVLGEKDEAFRWLEAAFDPPRHHYLPWMRFPPAFKPLHDDPRFGDLLRRMNLPE